MDKSRLTGIMNDHNQEWNHLKWQLNMAVESNKKELERKMKEQEKSEQMEDLKIEINSFIEKIEQISSSQCHVLGDRHDLEIKTFLEALQGQQGVLDQFNKSIEPEYKEFIVRCRKFSLVSEENELKTAWERVWFLTKNLIDKLKACRTFSERVELANQVIVKWTIEAERFEREAQS